MWYIEDVLPLIKVYLEDKRELGIEIILAHLFILNSYLDTKMQPKIYNYILSGNRKSYENTYIKDVVVIYKKYAAILMMKHENTEWKKKNNIEWWRWVMKYYIFCSITSSQFCLLTMLQLSMQYTMVRPLLGHLMVNCSKHFVVSAASNLYTKK